MKTELKITKMEVSIRTKEENFNRKVQDFAGHLIASVYGDTDEETQSNAELICEAFNVANETGLTPKMMQEQNEKMLKCLEYIKLLTTGMKDSGIIISINSEVSAVLQSIQKGETSK